MSEQCFRWRFM